MLENEDFGKLPLPVMADPKLSFGAKVLYAALMYHARNREKVCFPNNQILADELNTSVRHITRLLTVLKAEGYISVENLGDVNGTKRHITFLKWGVDDSDCPQDS